MTAVAVDRDNLRKAIISASMQIGSELGEDGLTMRSLASALGVSPTAVYQYFDGKTAILREIRVRGLTRLLGSFVSALELETPREVLMTTGRRYIEFARENPWLYRVLFEGSGPARLQLDEEQRVIVAYSEQRLATGNRQLFASLAMRGEDVLPHFLASWWCSLHGLCSLMISGQLVGDTPVVPVVDLDQFIGDHLEYLVSSLLRRAGL